MEIRMNYRYVIELIYDNAGKYFDWLIFYEVLCNAPKLARFPLQNR